MELRRLLDALVFKKVHGMNNKEVSDIQMDSRKVVDSRTLFICVKGHNVDGHQYIPQLIERGVSAFLVEEMPAEQRDGVTYIEVPDTKKAMAIVASTFFEFPSKKIKVIGITGTNGKTTVSTMIKGILDDMGHKTGLIGTMHIKIGDRVMETKNTTPESIELQRVLHEMVNESVQYVIMEVSSHALELGRVNGIEFDHCIFTNLSQDHLDFHETMEEYRKAKGLLFERMGNSIGKDKKSVILNKDDKSFNYYNGLSIHESITYGLDDESKIKGSEIKTSPQGTSFKLTVEGDCFEVKTKLLGIFNVYNTLATISLLWSLDYELNDIIKSLEDFEGVQGRMESVYKEQDYSVIVDYAHTPDALENVLKTARSFTEGKVICVVGCGGDRDKSKRSGMGGVAKKYSDMVVFTSDNPRTESPSTIIEDMLKGVDSLEGVFPLVNRKSAIEYAVKKASKGDCVLIAGKGHETYQIVGEHTFNFDDREIAKEFIIEYSH